MTQPTHACLECGTPLTVSRRGKEFCSTICRQKWNNRRLQRGAEIYDLFRALRRERDDAKALNLWTEICRLEFEWQQEDERERPDRRSYLPPRRALANLKDKGSLPMGEVVARSYLTGFAT